MAPTPPTPPADPETESGPQEAEDDGVSPVPRASRAAARSVPGDELAGARSAAAALAARLAAWPAEASAAEHLARLTALLGDELGWSLGSARRGRPADLAPVFAAMDELAADLPAGFPITLAELARLLGRALAASPDAARTPAPTRSAAPGAASRCSRSPRRAAAPSSGSSSSA